MQGRNFTTNVPRILDFKSSSEQIFFENRRWVPLKVYMSSGVDDRDLNHKSNYNC